MPKFDMKNDIQVAVAISAALSGATPSKGNIVDLQGYEAATLVLLNNAVTDAGTAAGFAYEVQESDTTVDTDFTAVANEDLVGLESALTVTSDSADNVINGIIGYIGNKRYARVVATGTSGTDALVSGVWIKGRPYIKPPATSTAAPIAAT
jgi:hypothetical protein